MHSEAHIPLVIDSDISPASLPANRAIALVNVTPEHGYLGLAAGNVALPPALNVPAGTNECVGQAEDHEGRSIIYWVWNSNGNHRMLRFFVDTETSVELLAAPVLDLRQSDEINQTAIIGDYLAWLDRDGRQYRLNMRAAEAGQYAGITDLANFRLALPVPLYPAVITRVNTPPGTANLANRIGAEDWQVAYRYGYVDNDATVLVLSDVNRATKALLPFDALQVAVPGTEAPSPLVQRIEFYARKNSAVLWGKIAVIKRSASGAFPIGPVPGSLVSFYFYGQVGDTLNETAGNKLSEAIPLSSKALGAARSRFFLANNERGYATADVALMAAVEETGDHFQTELRAMYQVKLEYGVDNGNVENYREGYVYFLLTSISGTHGTPDARYTPSTYNPFLDAALEIPDAPIYTLSQLPEAARKIIQDAAAGLDVGIRTIDQAAQFVRNVTYVKGAPFRRVKSNASYQLGLEFYDYAGNSSGTLTSASSQLFTADLAWLDLNVRGSCFRWTLTGTNPIAEIPSWAVAYRVVATPAQNYGYFQQLCVAEVLRLKLGASPNKPEFVDIAQPGGNLWLDISVLGYGSAGYVWSADSNDRVRIWESPTSNVVHDYKIVGQQGEWLLVDEPVPVAYARMTRAEIYSLREGDTTQQQYYATGPTHPVLRNNGIPSYSVTTGTLDGDVFVSLGIMPGVVGVGIETHGAYSPASDGIYYVTGNAGEGGQFPRTGASLMTAYYALGGDERRVRIYGLYSQFNNNIGDPPSPPSEAAIGGIFEVVSPLPKNNAWWLTDRGRPSVVLDDGPPLPATLPLEVCWGGVLLPGSRINGLASFDDEDIVTLPAENGPITSLVLTNQQQSDGTVLIGWQQHGAASLYLEEAVLTQPTGESLRADSSKVVGTVRPLAGKRGTTHPGSVRAWDGVVWAWSQSDAEFLRYDQSGITRLSKQYNGRRLCRALAKLYPNARITGGYDPTAEVYYLTFGATTTNGVAVPARTIGFSEREGQKGFCGDYTFTPRVYASLGTYLYSFDGALLKRHDDDAPRATYSGTLYAAKATFVANTFPKVSKEWLSLAFHGTDAWDAPLLENEQAGGVKQHSRTLASWAQWNNGAYVVALRRDELRPVNVGGTLVTDPAQLLHVGRPLQSPWLAITVQILSNKRVRLDGVTVNFNLLSGQQAVPTQ